MANNINLIAFGTFGSPNGFKQTFFVGNKDLAKSVKTFDLNTNAIKLFVNSKVYSIRKEYANGFSTIAYSLYSYAREQNSDRSGTFIGSSILFTNMVAQEHITISQLKEFHNQLVNKNVINEIISVNHSDKFSVVKPKDFDKIGLHLRDIGNVNFKQNSDNFLVVFCNIDDISLSPLFEKSLDLLNLYDTIYFTDSSEVAEFVHQKGIFKLIQNVGEKKDFDKEINNLIEERKRKRDRAISEFEREVLRINEEKNIAIQEFKTQIEQNEITHLENERKLKGSKDDLNKLGHFYDDFLKNTKILIDQLIEDVKQIHNNNKNLFNLSVVELEKPNYTKTIPKPKPKGNLKVEDTRQDFENGISHRIRSSEESQQRSISLYKLVSLILSFVLIFSWIYILYFKSSSRTEVIQNQTQVNSNPKTHIQVPIEITKLEDLKPSPNSELNDNDYRIVAKNLVYNLKIEDVVKVIFDKNPTDIKNNYIGQESIYSKLLIERNKQCFEEKNGFYYFMKDSIRHIPTFKK